LSHGKRRTDNTDEFGQENFGGIGGTWGRNLGTLPVEYCTTPTTLLVSDLCSTTA
jgi:hypothetical protein